MRITDRNTATRFRLKELANISFGQLEGEKDQRLNSETFYPTETIKQLLKKNYNYVLSPKGVGKSAIFNALTNKFITGTLFEYNKHSIISINQAFGTDNDYLDPEKFTDTEHRRNYTVHWALYIMGELLKDIFHNYRMKPNFDSFKIKISKIEGLRDKFKLFNVLEIINQLNVGFVFNIAGQVVEVRPTIRFDEKLDKINLNEIFQAINDFYAENKLEALIVIDRIDSFVAKEQIEIQKNYLQGLIDCVEEIAFFKNLDPLLFLRTDLFYGFDLKFEYDKVKDRKIELRWEESEILSFIVYRFLSNDYIRENFVGHFYKLQMDTTLHGKKWKRNLKILWIKLKNQWKKIIKKSKASGYKSKNIPHQVAEKFLKMFFPSRIQFYDNKDFPEWIFEKFRDSNNYINPRVLIFFFNKLFENQYLYFRHNQLPGSRMEVSLPSSSPKCFDIFREEEIKKTYNTVQHEEIMNIFKLVKTKNQQILFKEINQKSFETGKFRLGDFNIKNLGIEREELENLLTYLKLLGFCSEPSKQQFHVPPIYQVLLIPPSGTA